MAVLHRGRHATRGQGGEHIASSIVQADVDVDPSVVISPPSGAVVIAEVAPARNAHDTPLVGQLRRAVGWEAWLLSRGHRVRRVGVVARAHEASCGGAAPILTHVTEACSLMLYGRSAMVSPLRSF